MTKLTLNPTEATPVVKASPGDDHTVDSLGRALTIRQPDVLQESRLVRLMGDDAGNQQYMFGYVLPVAMVVEIDGVATPFPTTRLEVDAGIKRLGREGIAAVMNALGDKAKEQGEGDAAIKK